MHSLNLVETLRKKCIKNPPQHNNVLIMKAKKDLFDWIELDCLFFLKGTATNLTSKSFRAAWSLSVKSFPHQLQLVKPPIALIYCLVTFSTNKYRKFTASRYSLPELNHTLIVKQKHATYDSEKKLLDCC